MTLETVAAMLFLNVSFNSLLSVEHCLADRALLVTRAIMILKAALDGGREAEK